jgi:hypothetical protein
VHLHRAGLNAAAIWARSSEQHLFRATCAELSEVWIGVFWTLRFRLAGMSHCPVPGYQLR